MAYNERDSAREGQLQLRHQHSASSDQGVRALIPMWDSSDPERAPPPLPLNPQSPSLTSRAGTSSAIQSAHAALNERARESGPLVPSLAKRVNDSSPERAVVKGSAHAHTHAHRRMQSMQPGSVRDLSLMIEGGASSPSQSPTRSSDRHHHRRPSTPSAGSVREAEQDKEAQPEPRTFERESSCSPMPGPTLTPIIRPTVRRPPPQSILGENTPPQSSTMLALQNMPSHSTPKEAEPPLSNITNGSAALVKPQSLDNISSQILSLTSIATALQKEMSQLSRRSRDNATDLLSLKEATTTRDEDIRKGLRDIIGNFNDPLHKLAARDSFSGLYLDNKPHNASSPSSRGFQLPRIPSPKSFSESIDRVSVSTPSLSGAETAASVVLLEKIIRDMSTREGQDSLMGKLQELSQKLSSVATSSKIDELADQVRAHSENAVILSDRAASFDGGRDLDHGKLKNNQVERFLARADSRRSSAPSGRGSDLLNDDLMKIIRSVKDSVAQGGGLTAEVKALVRELRGEVLGMGRELGKRLESLGPKAIEDTEAEAPPSKDAVSKIIDEGLEQMKDQLNHVLREHRRQSAVSAATTKTAVDYQEIYNAMRAALRDNEASRDNMPDLSRDDVLEAVREAWENYKPEIEVQQLGLEREEVLECLKEGLQEYAPRDERPEAATREEVFQAVVEGLKHFVPPQMDTPATLSRNEIIEAVRDCLEEFEFPVAASAVGADMTREEMVYAVKEGLNSLDLPRGHAATSSSDNEEVLSRLEDLLGYIKLEFRAVSQEAKDNVAANGRDTEQVLDATKDGLENLRIAIESYVERATGAAGQEEFMEGILKTMDEFRQDITSSITQSGETSREQLQIELESLREIVNSSMVPATPQQGNNKEIMEALHNAVTSLRQEILRPRQETSEILDALQDGLNELKVGIDRVTNKPVDLTANDEILDALKSGLDSVRSDIETIRDNSNDKAVATMSNLAPENDAVIPADMVKQDDIKNLEVLITQLRIKLEAMEPEPTQSVQKEDLTRLEDILRNVQQGVEEIGNREPPAAAETARDAPADAPATSGDAASKDDVQAIETILRNTKARLDDLIDGEQALRKEHLDVVEALILETRESMSAIVGQMESMSHKEDFATMETLLTQVTTGFDEMKERTPSEEESTDKVSKSDVEAVETVVLEIKGLLDGIRDVDFNALPKKEDLANVETIVKEAAEKLQKIESLNESSSTALEKRQEELDSASERVAEVKTFLEAFQETVKTKLDDGSTGIEALGKLLESMGEKFDKNENVGTDLKEMMDTMKSEFQESKEVFAGAKLESDEKLHEATESLGTKIGEKIEELVAKYDEFQAILDEKSQAGEARDIVTEAAVVGTKAVADELKLLVDTLGTTVTESMEKMEEASKTVFDKVEDLVTRSDEHHSTDKAEHEQTRDRVQQALSIVEGLQGDVSDFQPKILEAVKEVLALVGQHFEHSKSSATDIQDKIVEAKPTEEFMQAMLPPPDKFDDSEIQEKLNRLVEQKYDDSEIRERLERLLAAKYDDASVHEKLDMLVEARYDDTSVQEKLDRLVTDSDTTGQAMSRLESLDKVHETVVKTANEISEFLASQTQRIADEHEDREKTLQDTTISLERKRAEKDHVEASILSLKDEEDRLRNSVMTLRTEQESLIRQKARLTGDVSSLETALQLRKEELAEMEHRGERLERRILEGVMDHSRVLLMSKSTRGGESMNRKRVRKPANEDVVAARPSPKPAVNMALSSKRNLAPPGQPGMARRIVSLSQINNNSPTGGVKRSQSVRTPAGGVKSLRKRSWGGDAAPGFADIDKENISVRETVEEVDETEVPADDGNESDTGTLRRSSLVTSSTDLYTDSETGYSERDDDMASEWTDSMVSGPASSIAEATGGEMMDGNEMVVYGQ